MAIHSCNPPFTEECSWVPIALPCGAVDGQSLIYDSNSPLQLQWGPIAKGDRGEAGPQGTPGRDGINGTNGLNGLPGAPGRDGPAGPTGPAGRDGIDGQNGTNGLNGRNGATPLIGPTGTWVIDGFDTELPSRGEDGKDGKNGLPGATGPQGTAGPTGAQGPMGPRGPQGDQGTPGDPGGPPGPEGPAGPEGPRGPQGIPGIPGVSNIPGPIGPQGPQGVQGEEGPTGPQGIPGQNAVADINYLGLWTTGMTCMENDAVIAPTDGHSYICIVPTTTEEPSSGSSDWALWVQRGPQGIQGIQGLRGADGVQGIQGVKGDKGDPGEGIPVGGAAGQVLIKTSNTDYDTEWADNSATGDYLPITGGTLTGSLTLAGDPVDALDAATKEYVDEHVPDIDLTDYAHLSDVSTAISAHNTSQTAHDSVVPRIADIESKIPPQATSTNQLADKNFVNSTAANLAAWKVYKNTALQDFATAAELNSAVTFYRADHNVWVPTPNDYAVIISDETAPAPYTGETTRWKNFADVGWGYDFPLGRQFTASENAVLASGITQPLREKIERLPANEYMMMPDNSQGEEINVSAYQVPIGALPTTETYGAPYTIPKTGRYYFEGSWTFSSALTGNSCWWHIRINGIKPFYYSPYMVVTNATAANIARNDLFMFDATAGDIVEFGLQVSPAETLTASNGRLVFYPPKAIDPPFRSFNDKGTVPTIADLPTDATNMDLYFVVGSNKSVYARWVNGVLTWVDLVAINQVVDSGTTDWDNPTVIEDMGNQSQATIFPTGATSAGAVEKKGTVFTVPHDGLLSIAAYYSMSAGNYGTINPQMALYINGAIRQWVMLAYRGSAYRLENLNVDVKQGDQIQLSLATDTAQATVVNFNSTTTYVRLYPPVSGSGGTSALSQALNDHVADGTIHVTQGDKDAWNDYATAKVSTVSATTQVINSDISLANGKKILLKRANGDDATGLEMGEYGTYEQIEVGSEQDPLCLNHNAVAPDGTVVGNHISVNYKDVNGTAQVDQLAYMSDSKSNQAGQVKIRFDGLTVTGVEANTVDILSIRSATATEMSSPTTLWPAQAIADNTNLYSTGFFIQGSDETGDRLRENNVPGQVHRWRVAGNYTNKDIGNQGVMRCMIRNPDTGFKVSSTTMLPSGITDDDFTFEFMSIADADSLATGRGYQLGIQVSFDDPTLTLSVNSIVRVSEAVDPLR